MGADLMLRRYFAVAEAASRIGDAVSKVVDQFIDGIIEQEPDFTSRMVTQIENAMNEFHSRGLRWSAKVLTDRGRGSQEREFGADVLGVFDAVVDGLVVQKGFLAQSKFLSRNVRQDKREHKRLQKQCEDMLKHTPDAFVFLYSRQGVYITPALSVLGYSGSPSDLYSWGVQRFFACHFMSFIGDHRLKAPTTKGLDDLRESTRARNALRLEVRGG